MKPHDIDSIGWMQQLAGFIGHLNGRAAIGAASNDVASLMNALNPELQSPACRLIEALQRRLEQTRG